MIDWSGLVSFDVSPWELFIRGTLMYWFLFLIFRFLLRRDVGGLGVADVLLVVLVADASQNGMTGGYTSVAEGIVLVSTLVAWNYLLDFLAFHSRVVAKFTTPPPLKLIRNGRVISRHLKAELLSMAELWSLLREQGIESLHQVRSACLEGDGDLSVIRADEPKAKSRAGKSRKKEGLP